MGSRVWKSGEQLEEEQGSRGTVIPPSTGPQGEASSTTGRNVVTRLLFALR